MTPPAHGKVTVKQGRLRATNLKQCLGTDLPAFIAIYRSAQDFIGQDLFTLEVIGAEGKSQIQRITVTVMEPAVGQGIQPLTARLAVEMSSHKCSTNRFGLY